MLTRKRKSVNKVLEATYADLITMKPDDDIYFLSKRRIYGICSAVAIGDDCKYDNYMDASALVPDCEINAISPLTTDDTRARWVCFFKPSPYFFRKGADMDDVLRYRPSAFRMLRAFEGLSFIKIDDEEDRALKEYISLVNEDAYDNLTSATFPFDQSFHTSLLTVDLSEYKMDLRKSFQDANNREYVISEMLIESLLLQCIKEGLTVFGYWDHLTHQLIASPFKPLKYIDKIDIFGYRFSSHYEGEPKLITKYLLVELKKDAVNSAALEQTMQYVDWICNEYASGDYSKIEAYVVGDKATRSLIKSKEEICQRSFIKETHPAKPEKWNNLSIVTYTLDDNSITFEKVE